jgi:uncharacterized protein (DUF4415 family)
MKNNSTSTPKRLKVSQKARDLYAARDKSHDDPENPVLPPEMWEGALIGKYFRPIKTAVSFRIDNDVLAWLKSFGEGHLTRINEILRERMLSELRK